jgi:hypothetical protein
MNTRAESSRRSGMGGRDGVLALLKRHGIPVTRENYLHLAYMGQPPEEWTAEHEAELPMELQRR